jgi:Ser/Thr protein kinase RdoA (MazF antagonist)
MALASYGLEDARLRFIQYNENAIYRVDASCPSANEEPAYLPNRYALRIHAMADSQAIASEMTWLAALNNEAGLPVPAPVSTLGGRLLATIVTPGLPQGRVVSLLHWLNGRKIQKGLRPEHLTALGQVVAKLHVFSAGWQPPAGFSRPTWAWNEQLGGSLFEYSRAELVESMPVPFQEPFEIVSQRARQVMEQLGTGPDAYGLIHADLYPENVLFKAGKACPIDFEDCGYGYWIWDIAVALCTWAWGKDWERMRDAFHSGYCRFRTLPEAQWEMLDLFVATQFATMVLWASAFLKHDPLRVAEYEPWRNRNGNKLLEYIKR